MEKIIRLISKAVLAASTLLLTVACVDRIPSRYSPDDGRGGNNRRENPGTFAMSRANADYYGSFYGDQTADFLLYLSTGDTDTDGYFTGSATMLTLDLLARVQSSQVLSIGEYKCNNNKAVMTFMPGFTAKTGSGETYIDGSSLYVQDSPSSYASYPVTSGTVSIESTGTDLYKVTARVVVEGNEYFFTYEGRIPVTDCTQGGGSETGDYDEENFPGSSSYKTRAQAVYNGQVYENCDEYILFLYCGEYDSNGNFKTKGHEIALDILTPISDGKTIKYGTYACTSDDFTAYHFLDGYEEDGTVYPSYFYRQYSSGADDCSLDIIKSGTAYIGQTSSGYSVKVYYSTAYNSYLVNYDGPVEFIDNTTKSSAVAKARKPSASICEDKGFAREGIGTISARRSALKVW